MGSRVADWFLGRICVSTCNPTFSECCLKSISNLDFVRVLYVRCGQLGIKTTLPLGKKQTLLKNHH